MVFPKALPDAADGHAQTLPFIVAPYLLWALIALLPLCGFR
jgi:hypothetical protein